jgi:hypothetical protein
LSIETASNLLSPAIVDGCRGAVDDDQPIRRLAAVGVGPHQIGPLLEDVLLVDILPSRTGRQRQS